MQKFSLSSLDGLPEAYVSGGREYPINTDFRVILRIFRMLADVEISPEDKPQLLRRMFYKQRFPIDADAGFSWFVGMGADKSEPGGEKDFDYEQDAKEIYSAFMAAYGIDLLEAELHWWKFSALLNGVFCGENALSSKIHLRHIDDPKSKRETAIKRSKRAAELSESVSKSDAAAADKMRERLMQWSQKSDHTGGE